jgi:hypothetical protein
MNQRSHIKLCMSRNKICRRRLATRLRLRVATRFAADNEKRKRPWKEDTFFYIPLVLTSIATRKKIVLFAPLAFFFWICLTTRVHSCRDSGIRIAVVVPTCGVLLVPARDCISIHPSIHHDRSRKRHETQATKRVSSPTSGPNKYVRHL